MVDNESSFYMRYGKRVLDILLSFLALLALSPIFCLAVVLIRLDSPGAPFFFQKRFGEEGKPFRFIKFRSMVSIEHNPKKEFEPGCSTRITRLGRILRKTKIDELPALFNVLLGQMSIVGPRPEVEKYVRAYPEDYKMILKIRPGLSDFASIKYRDEEQILARQPDPEHHYIHVILPDKLRLAKRYAEEVSFKTDIGIIMETFRAIRRLRRLHGLEYSEGREDI